MAERYFEREEVERLIPQLTRIMERMMAAQTAVLEANQWLQGEQRRIELAGGGTVDQAAWRATRERRERGTRDVQQFLLWGWVAYKERTWPVRIGWLVGILLFGNIAMALYVLIQVFRLPAGAPVERLLLRRHD